MSNMGVSTEEHSVKLGGTSERPLARPRLLLLALMLAIALLPILRPSRSNTLQVNLAGPVSYTFNIDSGTFTWNVLTFPAGIASETGKIHRDRPLYTALGWLIYRPLSPLRSLVPPSLSHKVGDRLANSAVKANWANIDPRDAVIAFGSLVLLNLALYWSSLCLIYASLCTVFRPRLALLLALVPATHFDAISFYLVPHTEPLNVFMPALWLWTLTAWHRRKTGLAQSAVMGFFFLGKGLPYLMGSWAWEFLLVRGLIRGVRDLLRGVRDRNQFKITARALALSMTLLLAPGLLYVVLLRLLHVPFYSHSASREYRDFVWILDYLREGRPVAVVLRIFAGFQAHAAHVTITFFIVCCGILVLLLRSKVRDFSLPGAYRSHVIVYAALCATFWALSGFLVPRLTITEFPPLIFALGTLAVTRSRSPERTVFTVVLLTILFRALGAFDHGAEPRAFL